MKELNRNDFKLTGEFKVSICGPENLFFIGHSILDFIAKSNDGIHWEQVSTISDCILCKKGESFKFNSILLEIVEKFNIPLKLYLNNKNEICIKYDEKEGNNNLIKQFANL